MLSQCSKLHLRYVLTVCARSGLAAESEYCFIVAAITAAGEGQFSWPMVHARQQMPRPPTPHVVSTFIANGTVGANWTEPYNGGGASVAIFSLLVRLR